MGVTKVKAKQVDGVLGGTGSGDMEKAVYDPGSIEADAFSMGNMQETTGEKVFTAAERTKLSGIESGAERNNIPQSDADVLINSGDASQLHHHDSLYLPGGRVYVRGANPDGLREGDPAIFTGDSFRTAQLLQGDTEAAYVVMGGTDVYGNAEAVISGVVIVNTGLVSFNRGDRITAANGGWARLADVATMSGEYNYAGIVVKFRTGEATVLMQNGFYTVPPRS